MSPALSIIEVQTLPPCLGHHHLATSLGWPAQVSISLVSLLLPRVYGHSQGHVESMGVKSASSPMERFNIKSVSRVKAAALGDFKSEKQNPNLPRWSSINNFQTRVHFLITLLIIPCKHLIGKKCTYKGWVFNKIFPSTGNWNNW